MECIDDFYICSPTPAFIENNNVIVMASSQEYSDYLFISMMSIKKNASRTNNYDFVVLSDGIETSKKNSIISAIVSENISVRFIDSTRFIDNRNLRTEGHVSKTSYLRLACIDLLANYTKVIYLDCDTVVNCDIAELYTVDIHQYMLAAATDSLMYGWTHMSDDNACMQKRYITNELNISEGINYFNAGVLLINIKEFHEKGVTSAKLLELAASRQWQWFDQDVLNYVCKGAVYYISNEWNVMVHVYSDFSELAEYYTPPDFYESYRAAIDNPKIVHYAGNTMPTLQPTVDRCDLFWKYCKYTRLTNRMQQILVREIINRFAVREEESFMVKLMRKGVHNCVKKAKNHVS